jgi:hypothetical protein
MTRTAQVALRGDEYIVFSYTRRPWGVWEMNGVIFRLPKDSDPATLGKAVWDALDASNRVELPEHDPSVNTFRAILKELGFRSNAQYMKGAREVEVSAEIDQRPEYDGLTRIVPYRNNGARGGFIPINEKRRLIDDCTPETLGQTVEAALADAE